MFMKKNKKEPINLRDKAINDLLSDVQNKMASTLGKKPAAAKVEIEAVSPMKSEIEVVKGGMPESEEMEKEVVVPLAGENSEEDNEDNGFFVMIDEKDNDHQIDKETFMQLQEMLKNGEKPEVLVDGKKVSVKYVRD